MKSPATVILGCAVPLPEHGGKYDRAKPPEPVLFAHCEGLDGDTLSVRDANLAEGIISRIEGKTADGILRGWPPESDFLHVWHIYLTPFRQHGRRLSLALDYRRLPGCSNEGAAMMMDFVAAIRRARAGA